MVDRTLAVDLYVRVCQDSGFQMDYLKAIKLVAAILQTTALDVWASMKIDFDTLERVAKGTHPAAKVRK